MKIIIIIIIVCFSFLGGGRRPRPRRGRGQKVGGQKPRKVGARGKREEGGEGWEAQNFAVVVPSPTAIFALFSLGGLLVATIQREDPQERKKKRTSGGRGEKRAKFWAVRSGLKNDNEGGERRRG